MAYPYMSEKSFYNPNYGGYGVNDNIFFEELESPSGNSNQNVYVNAQPDYSQLVDQIQKNNTWSAEQAQKQMDFQERLFNEANQFNRDEAMLNRAFQQESADKAMAFSSAENEANRAWQKMMSDTAHQREMADLKAAGLNPILAANNGASAGSGSAAMSAQAAGYAASSTGSPSGSKGDTDESGTMAIANLLGKMLDNQTEITKMITSAETARETAEMYTGATKYASELSHAASLYAADSGYAGTDLSSSRSSSASRYSADKSYEANLAYANAMIEAARIGNEASHYTADTHERTSIGSNPLSILGVEAMRVIQALGSMGVSAAEGAKGLVNGSVWNSAKKIGRSIYNYISNYSGKARD